MMINPTDSQGYNVEEISLKRITLIMTVSIILIAIFFVISREYFLSTTEDMMYEMVLKPESNKLIETRTVEAEKLTTFKLIDKDLKIYQIPVDDAKSILVKEYKNKPWTSK